jgi:hypothetical protein
MKHNTEALTIVEPSRTLPVIDEVDICVLGGSCTGVSAALRAARLGARVAVVEQLNCLGGAATAGMVCIWHSLQDTTFSRQIIAGTTAEILDRLARRPGALVTRPEGTPPYRLANICRFLLNTEELKIELDEMVGESGVRTWLHTRYAAPLFRDGLLEAVAVENKSGRGAIRARYFVDATADGDLACHLGVPCRSRPARQPATTGARVSGLEGFPGWWKLLRERAGEAGLSNIGWGAPVPGTAGVTFWATSNVQQHCESGAGLAAAEVEGRRQNRAMLDLLRRHAPEGCTLSLVALGSHIGIRETRNVQCQYTTTFDDITTGRSFPDAVIFGAYPPDIHHHDRPGGTYLYLDGVQESDDMQKVRFSRWRDEREPSPTFWQVPLRSLIPREAPNVAVCGRALDVDEGAFAAVRVMVSLNQSGEAAGVAAFEALTAAKPLQQVDGASVRARMAAGGSIIL